MKRRNGEEKWSLSSLADLEVFIANNEETEPKLSEKLLVSVPDDLSELVRRRKGLHILQDREGEAALGGRALMRGLAFSGLVAKVLGFLMGVGIVGMLLHKLPTGGGTAFNIWHLLCVTLGLQWLLVLSGVIFRFRGRMSWGDRLLFFFSRKLGGGRVMQFWPNRDEVTKRGFASALKWRLAGNSQMGAFWLGIGMIIGLVVCLFASTVYFYWGNQTESVNGSSLEKVSDILSLPWAWAGEDWVPGSFGVERSSLKVVANPIIAPNPGPRDPVGRLWMRFFVLSLLFWGVLPRLFLNVYYSNRERKEIESLILKEPRYAKVFEEL